MFVANRPGDHPSGPGGRGELHSLFVVAAGAAADWPLGVQATRARGMNVESDQIDSSLIDAKTGAGYVLLGEAAR